MRTERNIRMKVIVVSVLMFFYTTLVVGDMFLHNPRGSNNRLNGNAKGRGNANRMFDSQVNKTRFKCFEPQITFSCTDNTFFLTFLFWLLELEMLFV